MNMTMHRLLCTILFSCLVSSQNSKHTGLEDGASDWSEWSICQVDQGQSISFRFKICGDHDNPPSHYEEDQEHHGCQGTVVEVASRVCVPTCETVIIQRLVDEDGHLQSFGEDDEKVALCLQMAMEQSKIQLPSRNASLPTMGSMETHIQNQGDINSAMNFTSSTGNATVSYDEFLTEIRSLMNPVNLKRRQSIKERQLMNQIRLILAPLQRDDSVHNKQNVKGRKNFVGGYSPTNEQDLRELVNSQRDGERINNVQRTSQLRRVTNNGYQRPSLHTTNQQIPHHSDVGLLPVPGATGESVKETEETKPDTNSIANKQMSKTDHRDWRRHDQLGGVLLALKQLRNRQAVPQSRNPSSGDVGSANLRGRSSSLQQRRWKRDVDTIVIAPVVHVEVNGSIFHRVGQFLNKTKTKITEVLQRGRESELFNHLQRIGHAIRGFFSNRWSNLVEMIGPAPAAVTNTTTPTIYEHRSSHSFFDRIRGLLDLRNKLSDGPSKLVPSTLRSKTTNPPLSEQTEDSRKNHTQTFLQSDENSLPVSMTLLKRTHNVTESPKLSKSANDLGEVPEQNALKLDQSQRRENTTDAPALQKRIKRGDDAMMDLQNLFENINTSDLRNLIDPVLDGIGKAFESMPSNRDKLISSMEDFIRGFGPIQNVENYKETESDAGPLSSQDAASLLGYESTLVEFIHQAALIRTLNAIETLNHMSKFGRLAKYIKEHSSLTSHSASDIDSISPFIETVKNDRNSDRRGFETIDLLTFMSTLHQLKGTAGVAGSVSNERIINGLETISYLSELASQIYNLTRTEYLMKAISALTKNDTKDEGLPKVHKSLTDDFFTLLLRLSEYQNKTRHLSHYREVLQKLDLFHTVQRLNHYKQLVNDLASHIGNATNEEPLTDNTDILTKFLSEWQSGNSFDLLAYAEQLLKLALHIDHFHYPNTLRALIQRLKSLYEEPLDRVSHDNDIIGYLQEMIKTKVLDRSISMDRYRKALRNIAFVISKINGTIDFHEMYEKLLNLNKVPETHNYQGRGLEFLGDLTGYNSAVDILKYRQLLQDLIVPLQHQYKLYDLPTFVDRLFGAYRDIITQHTGYGWVPFVREALQMDQDQKLDLGLYRNFLRDLATVKNRLRDRPDMKVLTDQLENIVQFLDQSEQDVWKTSSSLESREHGEEYESASNDLSAKQKKVSHSLHRRQVFSQSTKKDNFEFLNNILDMSEGIKQRDSKKNSHLAPGNLLNIMQPFGVRDVPKTGIDDLERFHYLTSNLKYQQGMKHIGDLLLGMSDLPTHDSKEEFHGLNESRREIAFWQRYLLGKFYRKYRSEASKHSFFNFLDMILSKALKATSNKSNSLLLDLATHMTSTGHDRRRNDKSLYNLIRNIYFLQTLAEEYRFLDFLTHLKDTGVSKNDVNVAYVLSNVMDRLISSGGFSSTTSLGNLLQSLWFSHQGKHNKTVYQTLMDIVQGLNHTNHQEDINMMQEMSKNMQLLKEGSFVKKRTLDRLYDLMTLLAVVRKGIPDFKYDSQDKVTGDTKFLDAVKLLVPQARMKSAIGPAILANIAEYGKYLHQRNSVKALHHALEAIKSLQNNKLEGFPNITLVDLLQLPVFTSRSDLYTIQDLANLTSHISTNNATDLLPLALQIERLWTASEDRGDIKPLVHPLLHLFQSLSSKYYFKGDVEELQNLIERFHTNSTNRMIPSDTLNTLRYIFEGNFAQSVDDSDELNFINTLGSLIHMLHRNPTLHSDSTNLEFLTKLMQNSERGYSKGGISLLTRFLEDFEKLQKTPSWRDFNLQKRNISYEQFLQHLDDGGLSEDEVFSMKQLANLTYHLDRGNATDRFLRFVKLLETLHYSEGKTEKAPGSLIYYLLDIFQKLPNDYNTTADVDVLRDTQRYGEHRNGPLNDKMVSEIREFIDSILTPRFLDIVNLIHFLKDAMSRGYSSADDINILQTLSTLLSTLHPKLNTEEAASYANLLNQLSGMESHQQYLGENENGAVLKFLLSAAGNHDWNLAGLDQILDIADLLKNKSTHANAIEIQKMVKDIWGTPIKSPIQTYLDFLPDVQSNSDAFPDQDLGDLYKLIKTHAGTFRNNPYGLPDILSIISRDKDDRFVSLLRLLVSQDSLESYEPSDALLVLNALNFTKRFLPDLTEEDITEIIKMYTSKKDQKGLDEYFRLMNDLALKDKMSADRSMDVLNKLVKTRADRFRQHDPYALSDLLGIISGSRDERFVSLLGLLLSRDLLDSYGLNKISALQKFTNLVKQFQPSLAEEDVVEIMKVYTSHMEQRGVIDAYFRLMNDLALKDAVSVNRSMNILNKLVKINADRFRRHDPYALSDLIGIISGNRDERFISLMHLLTSQQFLNSYEPDAILKLQDITDHAKKFIPNLKEADAAEILNLYATQEDQQETIDEYIQLMNDLYHGDQVSANRSLDLLNTLVKTHADRFRQQDPYALSNLLGIISGSKDERFISLLHLLVSHHFLDSYQPDDILKLQEIVNLTRSFLPSLADEDLSKLIGLYASQTDKNYPNEFIQLMNDMDIDERVPANLSLDILNKLVKANADRFSKHDPHALSDLLRIIGGSRDERFISLLHLLVSRDFLDSHEPDDILKRKDIVDFTNEFLPNLDEAGTAEIVNLYVTQEDQQETIDGYLKLINDLDLVDQVSANRSLDLLNTLVKTHADRFRQQDPYALSNLLGIISGRKDERFISLLHLLVSNDFLDSSQPDDILKLQDILNLTRSFLPSFADEDISKLMGLYAAQTDKKYPNEFIQLMSDMDIEERVPANLSLDILNKLVKANGDRFGKHDLHALSDLLRIISGSRDERFISLLHLLVSHDSLDSYQPDDILKLKDIADFTKEFLPNLEMADAAEIVNLYATQEDQQETIDEYIQLMNDLYHGDQVSANHSLDVLNKLVMTHADGFRQHDPHALSNLLGIISGSKDERFISLLHLLVSHDFLDSYQPDVILKLQEIVNLTRSFLPSLADEDLSKLMGLYASQTDKKYSNEFIQLMNDMDINERVPANLSLDILNKLVKANADRFSKHDPHDLSDLLRIISGSRDERFISLLHLLVSHDFLNSHEPDDILNLKDIDEFTKEFLPNLDEAGTAEIVNLYATQEDQQKTIDKYIQLMNDLDLGDQVSANRSLDLLNTLVKTHADRFRQQDPYALTNLLGIISGSKDERFISLLHLLVSHHFLDSHQPDDILKLQDILNLTRSFLPSLADEDLSKLIGLYASQTDKKYPNGFIQLMNDMDIDERVPANRSLDKLNKLVKANADRFSKRDPHALSDLLGIISGNRDGRFLSLMHLLASQKFLESHELDGISYLRDIVNLTKEFLPNVDKGETAEVIKLFTSQVGQEETIDEYIQLLNALDHEDQVSANHTLGALKKILKTHADKFRQHDPYTFSNILGILSRNRNEHLISLLHLLISQQFLDSYNSKDTLTVQNSIDLMRRFIPHLGDEDAKEIIKLYTSQVDQHEQFAELMSYLGMGDQVSAGRSFHSLKALETLSKGLPSFGSRTLRHEELSHDIIDLLGIFDTKNANEDSILPFIDSLTNVPYRPKLSWTTSVLRKIKQLSIDNNPANNLENDMLRKIAGIFRQTRTGPTEDMVMLLDDVKTLADDQISNIDAVTELGHRKTIKTLMKESTSALRSYLGHVDDLLGSGKQSNAASLIDFLEHADMDMDANEFNQAITDLKNLSNVIPVLVENGKTQTSVYQEVLRLFGPEKSHTSLLAFVDVLEDMFSHSDIDVSNDPTTLNVMGSYLENIPMPMSKALDDIQSILVNTEEARSYVDYVKQVVSSIKLKEPGMLSELKALRDLKNKALVVLLERFFPRIADEPTLNYLDRILGQETADEIFTSGLETALQDQKIRKSKNLYKLSRLLWNYTSNIFKTVNYKQYFGDLSNILDVIGEYNKLGKGIPESELHLLELFKNMQEFPDKTFTEDLFQSANVNKNESRLNYQQITEDLRKFSEPNFMEFLKKVSDLLRSNPDLETDDLLNMFDKIDLVTDKHQELEPLRNILEGMEDNYEMWKQNASKILREFIPLLGSSKDITEKGRFDMLHFFAGQAYEGDEAPGNDTLSLYELINSYVKVSYNVSRKAVEELLAIIDTTSKDEKNGMFPALNFIREMGRTNNTDVGSDLYSQIIFQDMYKVITEGKSRENFTQYLKKMQELFGRGSKLDDVLHVVEQVSPASEDGSLNSTRNIYNRLTLSGFHFNNSRDETEDILNLFDTAYQGNQHDSSFLRLLERMSILQNDSDSLEEVRKLFHNLKVFDALNEHEAVPTSIKDYVRYLDSIQEFIDTGSKNDVLDVLQEIFPVSENSTLNKALTLYKLITRTFKKPLFTRGPFGNLVSFLRDATTRKEAHVEETDDMMILRLVDKLKSVTNTSHQLLLLHRTFNNMISNVSITYNRTITSILEDILLLYKNEEMFPVFDLLQQSGPDLRIRNREENLQMFDQMSRQVPIHLQLTNFTQFLRNLEYEGHARTPKSEGEMLVNFLKNESNFRFLKPIKFDWEDYFQLITNMSTSAKKDVLKTYDTILEQPRQDTTLLTIDQSTLLIDILKNISQRQWMHQEALSWRHVYDSFRKAPPASEGKHLNEFIKHLFSEIRNKTIIESSDGMLLDMIEGIRNKSVLTPEHVLNWMEVFRAIKEISLKEFRNTLESLLEILSTLDVELERPQQLYPTSNQEILEAFEHITEFNTPLERSDSLKEFNIMLQRVEHTENELKPRGVKGNRRLLLQLDSLFNPEEFERKKREHVLLKFLLRIPRLLNASQFDDGDLTALQQINEFDFFDYSIYDEHPPDDNKGKSALIDDILGAMQKINNVNMKVWNNSFPKFMGESPSTSKQITSDLQRMYSSLGEGIRMMSKAFHGIISMLQNPLLTVRLETTTSPEAKELDTFLYDIGNISHLEAGPDLTLIEKFSQLTTIVKNTMKTNGSELEDVVGVFSSIFGPRPEETDEWRLKNNPPDPIQNWSGWGAWSTCSVTCGHGEHVRKRTCSINIEGLFIASDECIGNAEQVSKCQVECHEGSWEEWSSWSTCDNRCGLGNQTRSRQCGSNHTEENSIHPVNHLCNCSSDERRGCQQYDFDECSLHEIFLPGEWSEWSAWTTCLGVCKGYHHRLRSCNPLNKTRTTVPRMKRDEGLLCEGDSKENVSCEYSTECWKEMHPVIIASWTAWSRWSQCDNKCGAGNQTRSRQCQLANHTATMATHHGNHSCNGDADERRTCSEYDFDECSLHEIFLPGEWSEWSAWTTCLGVCKGYRHRLRSCNPLNNTRTIVTRMKRDEGLLCEGDSKENVSCEYSTECWKEMHPVIIASWTAWSRWSQCDNRCGAGNQTRSRQCQLANHTATMATHHGSHSCYGDADERRTCSEYDFDECTLHHIFVPGTWSKWSGWSECSENCPGHRNRHRLCHPLNEHSSKTTRMKRDNGLLCEGNSTQNSSCISSGCERIINTSLSTAHDEHHHHHHHHHKEGEGTSSPVILFISMTGFILVVIVIIWYFVTSHQRRGKKPYRTDRGNSTQSVFQTKRSSSGESGRSSSTRSFLSWRSKSQESARFSDQQSEESARLLDDEQAPPETSRFRPYRQPSRSTKDDISAEWLWPWETEGDDWAALDFEANTASSLNFDVYMEVDESVEEPHVAMSERALSPVDNGIEGKQDSTENKMVELEKSAEAWFD